jgi:tetrahydromethanopterin S-methyltransferase subunit B
LNKSKDDIAQNRFKDAAENIRHLEDLVRNYEHQLNTIASKIASFFERENLLENHGFLHLFLLKIELKCFYCL